MLRFLGLQRGGDAGGSATMSRDNETSQWARDKLAKLSRDEKIALTAGSDMWRTVPVSDKDIPYIKLTDGPQGARGGGGFRDSTPSTLFPSPSCLGATWDTGLAHDMGRFIGLDAHEKLCHVVLGPTINIQRDPRAGRYFESYSEDPHLSGQLGCAWVDGAQTSIKGMAATMKHLVCNEAETDRRFSSSDLSAEALREVYLEPFREIMAGLKRRGHKEYGGQPACVMVSYNRINGVSASENDETVNQILRKEWGFNGLVTSDWFSLHAPGLEVTDLEMPGPALHRKMPDLLDKVDFEKPEIKEALDRCALKVLDIIHKTGKLGYSKSPESEKERSVDVNKVGPTIRRIAAEGAVLFKNEQNLLPIEPKKGMRIACIGKPWVEAVQSGGGSADLTPQKVVQPLSALKEALKGQNVEVTHHYGCDINNFLPLAPAKAHLTYSSGRTPGQGNVIGEQHVDAGGITLWHPKPDGLEANNWWLRIQVEMPPCERAGKHTFGFTSLGDMTIKAASSTTSSKETRWEYEGEKNIFEYSMNPYRVWRPYEVVMDKDEKLSLTLDYVPIILEDTMKQSLAGSFGVGFQLEKDEDDDIREAAKVASEADVAVVLTALGKDWEAEGFDAKDIKLPRKQDQLVAAIAQAQSNSVVMNITGRPVEMPWLDKVPAVVQAWYGGQEGGEALVDILLGRGDAPASGRLGSTWPKVLKDHPSARDESTFPGVKGDGGPHVTYNEGRLIGYRWYNTQTGAAKPGHWLGSGIGGFTRFETSLKKVEGESSLAGSSAKVVVVVTTKNVGKRSGKEIAQVYLRRHGRSESSGRDAGQQEPVQKLIGFAAMRAKAGASAEGRVTLYQDAFSFWDEAHRRWQVHAGKYDIVLARSADLKDTFGSKTVEIKEGWTWTGIGV